jgi:hypothetical protein
MSQEKYIGMDVHQATISVAVMDGRGKLIMECILETKAATILPSVRNWTTLLKPTLALAVGRGCPEVRWCAGHRPILPSRISKNQKAQIRVRENFGPGRTRVFRALP